MPGYIIDVDLDSDGGARSCSMADGSPLRELIVNVDDDARRFVYSIVEAPLPMRHHNVDAGICRGRRKDRFVWISDFLPTDLGASIGELIDGAAVNIEETLDGAAIPARRRWRRAAIRPSEHHDRA
jgi:hypothetical protein